MGETTATGGGAQAVGRDQLRQQPSNGNAGRSGSGTVTCDILRGTIRDICMTPYLRRRSDREEQGSVYENDYGGGEVNAEGSCLRAAVLQDDDGVTERG